MRVNSHSGQIKGLNVMHQKPVTHDDLYCFVLFLIQKNNATIQWLRCNFIQGGRSGGGMGDGVVGLVGPFSAQAV